MTVEKKHPEVHMDLVFGRVVAYLRTEDEGLSQVAFAKKCSMSAGSIARIESGRTSMSAVQERAIETVLGEADIIHRRGVIQTLASRCIAVLERLGCEVRLCSQEIAGPRMNRKRLNRMVGRVCSRWLDEVDAPKDEE